MRITVGPGSRGALVVELEGVGPMSIEETESLVGRLRWALVNALTRMHPTAPCSCYEWEPSEEEGYQRLVHDPVSCDLIAVVEVPQCLL